MRADFSNIIPDENLNLYCFPEPLQLEGGEASPSPVLDGPPAALRLVPGPVLGLWLVDDLEDNTPITSGSLTLVMNTVQTSTINRLGRSVASSLA